MTLQADFQQFLLNAFSHMNKDSEIYAQYIDVEYWKSQGITNAEEFEHNDLASVHWDMYKDVHNIRPRWYDYSKMTIQDLKNEIDDLEKEIIRQNQSEAERRSEEERMVKERFAKNEYQPNLAFSGLKDLMAKS